MGNKNDMSVGGSHGDEAGYEGYGKAPRYRASYEADLEKGPGYTASPRSSVSGRNPYPMQEVVLSSHQVDVIPNVSKIRGRNVNTSGVGSSAGSHHSGYEEKKNHLDISQDDDDEDNIRLVVKPKALYQSPQTPNVLPSRHNPINRWAELRENYFKEFFAEFLGTMVLVFFGDAVVVQVKGGQQSKLNSYMSVLEQNNMANDSIAFLTHLVTPDVAGSGLSISLCWAAGVVIGFYAAGGGAISGGHLNPAVTLANFVFRGMPAKKVPIFWLAQMLGGYFGGLLVFWYYHAVIVETWPDWRTNEAVVGCFSVVPLPYLDSNRQFISELVIGALLILGIFAMTDSYTCLSPDLFPVMLFLLIFALLAAGALQTGAVLNPARDIGPRLAMWTVGFSKSVVWDSHSHFFWVSFIGPLIGGCLGGLLYDLLIFQGHESPINRPLSQWSNYFKSAFVTESSKLSNSHHPSSEVSGSPSEKEIQLVDIQSKGVPT